MIYRMHLRKECEEFVQRMIESGRYESVSDVVDSALHHFEERERYRQAKLDALRAEIQKGIDSGPGEEFDPVELAEHIKRRGRERLIAEQLIAKEELVAKNG